MVKKGSGWHGERKRHSEVAKKGATSRAKNSSGKYYTRKTPRQLQNKVFRTIPSKDLNRWEYDTGFKPRWLNAFEEKYGKITKVEDFDEGKTLETEDGREWHVFSNYREAVRTAEAMVEKQLEDDLDSFEQDWLEQHLDLEGLGDDLAEEMYDTTYENEAYEWEGENPEKKKRIEELDKKRDKSFKEGTNEKWFDSKEGKEYWSLQDEKDKYAESTANIERDEIKEDPLKWWDDATGDPIPENWFKRHLDVQKASEDKVKTDGVAPFLAGYDGKEVEENGKFMYRHN